MGSMNLPGLPPGIVVDFAMVGFFITGVMKFLTWAKCAVTKEPLTRGQKQLLTGLLAFVASSWYLYQSGYLNFDNIQAAITRLLGTFGINLVVSSNIYDKVVKPVDEALERKKKEAEEYADEFQGRFNQGADRVGGIVNQVGGVLRDAGNIAAQGGKAAYPFQNPATQPPIGNPPPGYQPPYQAPFANQTGQASPLGQGFDFDNTPAIFAPADDGVTDDSYLPPRSYLVPPGVELTADVDRPAV